jgi:predicted ATP-grasp superfamily ATP-dependent carboligase
VNANRVLAYSSRAEARAPRRRSEKGRAVEPNPAADPPHDAIASGAPAAARRRTLRLHGADPLPAALLPQGGHYGTLAAARALWREGVEVHAADARLRAPARWSSAVTRVVACPDVDAAPTEFVGALLRLGAREPGRALLATSDDVAWLYAQHRDELARRFHVAAPAADAVYALLNKWRMHAACAAVGLETPRTWLPRTDADVDAVARDATFPVLIKPQTQVLLSPHRKAAVVEHPAALRAAIRQFTSSVRHHETVRRHDPEVQRPMVQEFVPQTRDGVYSLSGFVGAGGELLVVQGTRKVLQRPLLTGIGLCFEDADVVPELARGIAALCRHVGYDGVFEAEFIDAGGRLLLIDFNPRFFGQMGFDVARGANLPHYAYLTAIGRAREAETLARAAARRLAAGREPRVYCNALQVGLYLPLLYAAGRIDGATVGRWTRWLVSNRRRATDAVLARGDLLPAAVDAVSSIAQQLQHPRSTWRTAATG